MVSLYTEVLKARQSSKSCSFELGQGYFTVVVLVHGFENGINDGNGLLLVLLVIL